MAAAATVTVENNSLALSSIKGAKADAEKGYKRKRERRNKETNQYTKKKENRRKPLVIITAETTGRTLLVARCRWQQPYIYIRSK